MRKINFFRSQKVRNHGTVGEGRKNITEVNALEKDSKQVMRNRKDVFALNINQDFKDIIPEIIKSRYSRIPVYRGNLNQITGILHVKDLLLFFRETNVEWQKLLRKPFFVTENKKLGDLLMSLRNNKKHLAVVVDEYGSATGIITLEDVVEEIVGKKYRDFDDEDIIFSKLDEQNFILEGKTFLKDLYKIINLKDASAFDKQKGGAENLSDFLLRISSGLPKKGDVIIFQKFTFTIEVVDGIVIKQIKLSIGTG